MTDAPLSPDLTDLLQRLGALDEPAAAPAPVRFIVATDWARAAAPLTILKAYSAMVPPSADVQLAFAVAGEPSASDAECVAVLAEGAGCDLRGLEVLSFAQAVEEPYDSAVVPGNDDDVLIAQVGGLIVRMHDVVRRLQEVELGGGRPSGLNVGDREVLRRRLAAFPA